MESIILNCQNLKTGQERVKKFGFSLPIEEGNKIWLKPINIKFCFYYLHFYTHPFFIHTHILPYYLLFAILGGESTLK